MTYAYTALEPSGKKKTGFIDAADRDSAIALVTRDGRFVVEIKEEKNARVAKSATATGRKHVSRSDLALFSRRLADLSAAGLPLDRVLQVISEQSESSTLSLIAEEALADVRSGLPVSDALAKHPKLFPPVYTLTLKSGEASGQFPQVAERLADFQEIEVTRRNVVTSALIYPAVLACVAVGVVITLMTYVVPKLSGVFSDLDKAGQLPENTKVLLATSNFMANNWLFLLGGIVAIVLFYRAWTKTESGAHSRDHMLMRLPLIGSVVKKATVSRYSRVLGTLVYGGVPILEALNLAGMAAGNRVFNQSSIQVENDVREGKPIAIAMRDARDFPPVLINMVSVGEETGDLPKMLGRVSASLDFEVDNAMRRLTSMVEPFIILTMGSFVGFVVISVLLPIVNSESMAR